MPATPPKISPLAPHPRLYIPAEALTQLRGRQTFPLPSLRDAAQHVALRAEEFAASPALRFDIDRFNSLLERAREMQMRVVTLIARWHQTGEERFRAAAERDALAMCAWEYWSWKAWRDGNPSPDYAFDLSYGENCTTLALTLDLLADDGALSDAARETLLSAARERGLRPFLVHTAPDTRDRASSDWSFRAPWFGSPHTNWNTVCVGGAGMLALVVAEHFPAEAAETLARAEEAIAPYMQSLDANDGGWPEGIGYWGYGHRYAFMYLLSHERATGRPHPLLASPAVRQTLRFPLDFSPHGLPCSFGDVNLFGPLAFHHAAAVRLGAPELVADLDARARLEPGQTWETWPNAAELLLLHPAMSASADAGSGSASPPSKPPRAEAHAPVGRIYRGLDWGILADRLPEPRLYLSVRGGSTAVPHSHLDLMSCHGVFDGERLIHNIGINGGAEYLDSTFSPRRPELFEVTPASKNTILINGVGIVANSTARTDLLSGNGFQAIRIETTEAMGQMHLAPAALFCARLFVMLDARAFLILDRAELPHPGRVETRLHLLGEVLATDDTTLVRGKKARLRIAHACNVPAKRWTAQDAPTTPCEGATLLRWCTEGRTDTEVVMATLLWPGEDPARVALTLDDQGINVEVSAPDFRRTLHADPALTGLSLRSIDG